MPNKTVYPPDDIRNGDPNDGRPFMIQIKYLANPNGGVHMQIICPDVAEAPMMADMLRLAFNMAAPIVIDPSRKDRQNRVWAFLKGIGSSLRAPPESSIN